MNLGYVYVLTNDAMPGLVKVGRTSRDVDMRASELWQTGVPEKFDVFWSCKTPDCVQLEAYAHGDLRKCRVSMSREFFRADPEHVVDRVRFWAAIQANDWVFENFSEHTAVHLSEAAAASGVERLVKETGHRASLISDALAQVTADELAPAIERALADRRQEQIESFRRIGIPEEDWEGMLDE